MSNFKSYSLRWLLLTLAVPCFACAEQNEPAGTPVVSVPPTSGEASNETWAVHGQFTNVTQRHPAFRALYSGTNSLDAARQTQETSDVTLYAGVRLGTNAELWIDPEVDQGFGLSNTVGAAGFPSGEAYKIGANAPYLRLPRAFLRFVIPLGGDSETIDPAANLLGGTRPSDNVTVTVGKFGVVDIFDTNRYAHDPRTDFMNWSIIDAGPFDYAADAWGFTYGGAAEWNKDWWTLRGGLFQLSRVPNGKIVSVDFSQFSAVVEWEARHRWQDRPGSIKVLAFVNRGRMGNYLDATRAALTADDTPSTAGVRRRSSRTGITLNAEQELAADLGAFVRAGINDGRKEAYEFTEINRSISAGLSLKGARWGRPDDTLGFAGVVNRLSGPASAYFEAGGIGILIGDGALTYGSERIVEALYSLHLQKFARLSVDYQHITNPAYNRDRGSVSIFGARIHAEF